MSLDRNDLMRELELLPAWRLRAAPAAPDSQQEAPLQEAPVNVANPVRQSTPAEPPAAILQEAPAARLSTPAAPQIAQMGWAELKAAVSECGACALGATRAHPVFGAGDETADWMFVGEAPGAEEDRRGEPFLDEAGQLLDNMLAAIGLRRGENVYLANALKCHPPGNREPQADEMLQCNPYLQRQVELVRPRLIVAFGAFAAHSLLGGEQTVDALRGKVHDYHGVPLVVTYHPAHLLRSMGDKALAWEDLCLARSSMRDLQSASATPS